MLVNPSMFGPWGTRVAILGVAIFIILLSVCEWTQPTAQGGRTYQTGCSNIAVDALPYRYHMLGLLLLTVITPNMDTYITHYKVYDLSHMPLCISMVSGVHVLDRNSLTTTRPSAYISPLSQVGFPHSYLCSIKSGVVGINSSWKFRQLVTDFRKEL